MSKAMQKKREWAWDLRKERALSLVLKGESKSDVARQVKIDRKTLRAWMSHPEFSARLAEAARDRFETVRARRIAQQIEFADAAADLAKEAFKAAKKDATDRGARSDARAWGAEFRAWREQERIDWGEKASRVEVSVGGKIDVNQTSTHEISFRNYLSERIEGGVIDVEAVPVGDDVGATVAGLLKQALIADPGMVDAIHEEDRARAQAQESSKR